MYSVARTFNASTGTTSPFAERLSAVVPAGNMTTGRRAPSRSETAVLIATCMPCPPPRSISVTVSSARSMTTLSSRAVRFQARNDSRVSPPPGSPSVLRVLQGERRTRSDLGAPAASGLSRHTEHRAREPAPPITEPVVHSIGSLGRGLRSRPGAADTPCAIDGTSGGPQPARRLERTGEPVGREAAALLDRLFFSPAYPLDRLRRFIDDPVAPVGRRHSDERSRVVSKAAR